MRTEIDEMLQKKVCMLGAFAVGKTSLVRRFVESIFSEVYHTTIGVKIDKKVIRVGEQEVTMILWDLAGHDGLEHLRLTYLKGASGLLLVADGTRRDTLAAAIAIQEEAKQVAPSAPFVLAINKSDLMDEWELDSQEQTELESRGWKVILTSAKTGDGVEQTFQILAKAMLGA
ncbi:MAG TPA: Rab family GTPase [Blastocatellia bacterium]|nr:Rab family GTPase [Blastocatellia bacterium]